MNYPGLDELLLAALKEDIGTGDITTSSCVPAKNRSRGEFIAKEDGVVCGLFIPQRIFALLDPEIIFTPLTSEGDAVKRGEIMATVEGPSRGILTGERVSLNFLQRLSGISTATAAAVLEIRGTSTKITDTRKTAPGLRTLEKYAVRTGGGCNHRMGLSDGVLIKDNHIAAAGGIGMAVALARQSAPHTLKIEVEAETEAQVLEAIEAGADIIMLDNMDRSQMKNAVALIAGRALTEASGNMGERALLAVAETGVDYISIGALTHSVKALDISLKFSDVTN